MTVSSIAGALRVLLLCGIVIDALDTPARATRTAIGRGGRLRSSTQPPRQVMPCRPAPRHSRALVVARDARGLAGSAPLAGGEPRRELSARDITNELVRAEGARDIMRVVAQRRRGLIFASADSIGFPPLPAESSSGNTPIAMSARTALDEMAATGEFVRTAAAYRAEIAPDGAHPPAAGRYHLYVAFACPWAAGTLSMLYLKGLEGAVGVSVVHPTWARTRPDDPADTHTGWHFRTPGDPPVPNSAGYGANAVDDACVPDTVNGCKTVRELYEVAKDTNGKYTTPLLWDTATSTIVSNESTDILRILNAQLDAHAARADVNLYPPALEAELAALNEWIYPTINDGVYRSGFARTQPAYDAAVRALFASLERCDALLASRRYLTGSAFTWVDLRLFHTLVRFDPVYVTYFKTNLKRLADFAHLPNYVRDVYQIPEVRRSINAAHIKMHYFTSHPALNTYGVIPAYDGIDLDAPHGREALSS